MAARSTTTATPRRASPVARRTAAIRTSARRTAAPGRASAPASRTQMPAMTTTRAPPLMSVRLMVFASGAAPSPAMTTSRVRRTAASRQPAVRTLLRPVPVRTARSARSTTRASSGPARRGQLATAMTPRSARRTPATRSWGACTRTTTPRAPMGAPARLRTGARAACVLGGRLRTATTARSARRTRATRMSGV